MRFISRPQLVQLGGSWLSRLFALASFSAAFLFLVRQLLGFFFLQLLPSFGLLLRVPSSRPAFFFFFQLGQLLARVRLLLQLALLQFLPFEFLLAFRRCPALRRRLRHGRRSTRGVGGGVAAGSGSGSGSGCGGGGAAARLLHASCPRSRPHFVGWLFCQLADPQEGQQPACTPPPARSRASGSVRRHSVGGRLPLLFHVADIYGLLGRQSDAVDAHLLRFRDQLDHIVVLAFAVAAISTG
jgi:hypothetical protein